MEAYTFETAMHRIEEINERLSSGEVTVDESVSLYKEASQLLVHCHGLLADAKLQIDEIHVELNDEL